MRHLKLIALRKQHNLTQQMVASHLGIDATSYGRIETGKSLLLEKVMLKLCKLYTCNMEDLIEDDKLAAMRHTIDEEPVSPVGSYLKLQAWMLQHEEDHRHRIEFLLDAFRDRLATVLKAS